MLGNDLNFNFTNRCFIFLLSMILFGSSSSMAESESTSKSVSKVGKKLEVVIQGGYVGIVHTVDVSPDGLILASGSDDCTVRLWEVKTGRCIRILKGHKLRISSVKFSPRGKILASSSHDRTIKFWDVESGRLIRTLSGHSSGVFCVCFSHDGRFIASGGSDHHDKKVVRLWDVESGKLLRILKHSSVYSLAFSPNGQMLAAGSHENKDDKVKVWNIQDGTILFILDGCEVAFNPNGEIILTGGGKNNALRLWNAATGKLLQELEGHTAKITSITYDNTGHIIASSSYDNTIKLWDQKKGQCVWTIKGHQKSVTSIAFSPDGKTLVSGSYDDTIKLWNLKTQSLIWTLEGYNVSINSVCFDPFRHNLVLGSDDGEVKLWDIQKGRLIHILKGHSGPVRCVGYSPDGEIIASGGVDRKIKIWDAATGHLTNTLKSGASPITTVTFSPDGRMLASSTGRLLEFWDLESGSRVSYLRERERKGFKCISLSPDGKTLASGGGRFIKLWKVKNRHFIKTLKGDFFEVYSLSFSHDGKILASGNEDSSVRLWDWKGGQLITTFRAGDLFLPGYMKDVEALSSLPESGVEFERAMEGIRAITVRALHSYGYSFAAYSVAFSPRDNILAAGCGDGIVRLWNVETKLISHYLKGHANKVNSVNFSADGGLLASGGEDGTVKIWATKTGDLLATLFSLPNGSSVIVTPEGFFSATGDFNKYVHFVRGLEVYNFSQFYDVFYRPDLVVKKLRGEDISKYAAGLNKEDAIKNPPQP